VHVNAQSYVESALLFSRTKVGGSARTQGIGGAQTSLGGDYSAAFSNPAGLGFFNRNEFTVSPSLTFVNSSSDFLLGDSLLSNRPDSQTTFTLPGISVVFHKDFTGESNSVINGNFAISLNRINDFNSAFNYEGKNLYSSIINAFINTANGKTTSQFNSNGAQFLTPTWLAFNTFLIGDSSLIKVNGNPTAYFSDATELPYRRNGIPIQKERVQTSGGQNQITIAYGVNIQDKLFLGASLGLTSLRFSSRKSYKETLDSGPLESLQLDESLDVTGSGFNLTLGTIYKPIEFVQVGLSVATPTFYTLSDSYIGDMKTNWKNFTYFLDPVDVTKFEVLNNESATTDEITTAYTLSTPWRLNAGVTFLFEKKGFISIDVENTNYGSSSYTSSTDGVSFDSDNSKIKSSYKSVLAIRTGGEYRYKSYRFRAGYSLQPDPSTATKNSLLGDVSVLSFGTGYRQPKFYVDMALLITNTNTSYRPYPIGGNRAPIVKSSFSTTQLIFTVGFPF
jgi:hypothetical protein